jgi:transglutaminase-like putative cysteine protease
MVLPAAAHGDQTRVSYRLEVHGATAQTIESTDRFGNVVVDVRARWVAGYVEFQTWAVVDRDGDGPSPTVAGQAGLFLAPTALTAPDPALRTAAAMLARTGDRGLALAERVNDWAHGALRYRHGVTGVRTTASAALASGEGVCQDYAHVMLALCQLTGLPARYVSGHLQGEGGSHAWVEVLVPSGDGSAFDVVAFDPTNHRRAGPTYLTIAVGRDYGDVAPTYGTYSGAATGTLSTFKELVVGAVDLVPS